MNERDQIADQLRRVIAIQSDIGILTPEDYFALNDAIKELEKNCSNCRFAKIYDFERDDGKKVGKCAKATQPLPDDPYFVGYLELLEVTPDHFCGFHEPKDLTNE